MTLYDYINAIGTEGCACLITLSAVAVGSLINWIVP